MSDCFAGRMPSPAEAQQAGRQAARLANADAFRWPLITGRAQSRGLVRQCDGRTGRRTADELRYSGSGPIWKWTARRVRQSKSAAEQLHADAAPLINSRRAKYCSIQVTQSIGLEAASLGWRARPLSRFGRAPTIIWSRRATKHLTAVGVLIENSFKIQIICAPCNN